MPITISRSDGFDIMTVSGNPGITELISEMTAFFDTLPLFSRRSLLVDLRHSTENRSYGDVKQLVNALLPYVDRLSRRHAFLVDGDLHFGVARMFASLAEFHGFEIAVFRNEVEARAWLQTHQTPMVQGKTSRSAI